MNSAWTVTDVVDTRERDFETGKIIPNSGNDVPCDCCGRAIVIHVTVTDGASWLVVGLGCAKKTGGAVARTAKAMAARVPCPMVDGLIARGIARGEALHLAGQVKAWKAQDRRWDLLASIYSVHIDESTSKERAAELRAKVETWRAGTRARNGGAEREVAIDWLVAEAAA